MANSHIIKQTILGNWLNGNDQVVICADEKIQESFSDWMRTHPSKFKTDFGYLGPGIIGCYGFYRPGSTRRSMEVVIGLEVSIPYNEPRNIVILGDLDIDPLWNNFIRFTEATPEMFQAFY